APPVAATVGALLAEGALTVRAGRVAELVPEPDGFTVAIAEDRLRVGAVVNCTGPGSAAHTPLGRALLADGLARPDPLRLGLDVDPAGRLVAADGAALSRVAVIGPPRRGRWWGTTAVLEIRDQVAAL